MATQTITSSGRLTAVGHASSSLKSDAVPAKLAFSTENYPRLSAQQASHLRHFHNLATQIDGEWRHMGTQEPAQEFLDAYRYQLATMCYAAGLAHYHRMPLLRTVFKSLMRSLIHKMLRREVWGYWFNTSHSGPFVDPSLTELRKPWADPVVRENIMYSGHLLLMTSLYAMLFDDDEFEKPGSLTFDWTPMFWGWGPEKFEYDNRSLQDAILKEMERNGWMGVCCEPNLVFVVCNQFPLIAMRYNDVRDGTDRMEGILDKYRNAWKEKGGRVHKSGLYVSMWVVKQDTMRPPMGIGWTAWANAFMNSWNSEAVYDSYPGQSLGYLVTLPPDPEQPCSKSTTVLNPTYVAEAFRNLVESKGADPHSVETLREARKAPWQPQIPGLPYKQPDFGYVVEWLSELGKEEELNNLLDYADQHFTPTREQGGLFYPRCDQEADEQHNRKHVDPFTGNAAIGYARLNVKDGQKIMYENPWTRQTLSQRPWVDTKTGLGSGVDFLRGQWDEGRKMALVTMRTWHGAEVSIELMAKNLTEGKWAAYVDGSLLQWGDVEAGGELSITVTVGQKEVDVVFLLI